MNETTKVTVDYNSIKDLSNKLRVEFDKLGTIIDKMRDISVNFSDMLDTSAGNMYKDVMIAQLDKEKEVIGKKRDMLCKIFDDNSLIYDSTFNNIKKNVGGIDGEV